MSFDFARRACVGQHIARALADLQHGETRHIERQPDFVRVAGIGAPTHFLEGRCTAPTDEMSIQRLRGRVSGFPRKSSVVHVRISDTSPICQRLEAGYLLFDLVYQAL